MAPAFCFRVCFISAGRPVPEFGLRVFKTVRQRRLFLKEMQIAVASYSKNSFRRLRRGKWPPRFVFAFGFY